MNSKDWKAAGAELASWAKKWAQAALAVAGALLLLGFIGGFSARHAAAAAVTIDLPMCASFTYANSTLTCVPAGTTPPVTPPPVTPPVTPPPTAGCPAGTIDGKEVWGNRNINVTMGDGQAVVFRITPTEAQTSAKNSTWASGAGGAPMRDFVLSTSPCDWDGVNALPNPYAPSVKVRGTSTGGSVTYRACATTGGQCTMQVGKTYFLSFRNLPGYCTSGACILLGGVPK